jgi:hypothetical protein
MIKSFLVLIPLLLVGCATSQERTLGDGTHSISCKKDIENCYDEALSACEKGYDTLNQSDSSQVVMLNGNPVTIHRWNMRVKCKG